MKVFGVDVGVALKRPPKTDEYRRVVVAADNETEASLLAAQIAQADDAVVMATETTVTDWPDDPYIEEADANPERRNNGCMVYRVNDSTRPDDESSRIYRVGSE